MKNNKPITAVEWQFDELQMAEKDYKNEVIDGWEYAKRKYFILKQANKLFEEQIVEAFDIADNNYPSGNGYDNGSNYYSETFNQPES